jgi:hypothetical protein
MKSIAVFVASLAVVTAFAPQHNVAPSSTKLDALADAVSVIIATIVSSTFLTV